MSTIDAISRLLEIIKETNGRGQVVSMLTLDVCSAFNSASWRRIRSALEELGVPKYLQEIIGVYLSNRKVLYETNENNKEYKVERLMP